MIFIAAGLFSGQFSFPGGNASQLAQTISDERHRAVVIMCPHRLPNWQAFSVRYLDEPNLINRVGRAIELEPEGKNQFAFAPNAWPDEFIGGRWGSLDASELEETTEPWPSKPNLDGTITIRSEDKPLSIKTMTAGPWPKPIRIVPFYESFRVVVAASSRSPEEVFRTVAAAVGGKPVLGEKEWSIVFEAKEYRRRLVALLRVRVAKAVTAKQDPIHIADAQLCSAALDEATDQQLERAVVSSDAEILIPIQPNSALANVAARRVEVYANMRFGNEGQSNLRSAARIAKMLDTSKPMQVVLNVLTARTAIQGKIKGDPTGGVTF